MSYEEADGVLGADGFAYDGEKPYYAVGALADYREILAFAEAGTLHLDNVVSGGTLLEKTFTPVNCTGVANLSNWTLLVNGAATSKYTASVSEDGKVRLASVAMRVIIR